MSRVVIELNKLFKYATKLSDLKQYTQRSLELAGEGNEVVLTCAAPVWLYLKIAHSLHGKVKRLIYNSPVTADVVIFDHDPF